MLKGNQLAINMVSNLFSFSVSLLISFLFLPYVINSLGKDVYSFYPLSNNIVSYLMLVSLTLNSMVRRHISVAISSGNIRMAIEYYSTCIVGNMLFGMMVSIASVIFVLNIEHVFDIPVNMVKDVSLLMTFMLLGFVIRLPDHALSSAPFVKERLDLVAYGDLASSIIKLASFSVLFFLFPPKVFYLGLATVVVSAFTMAYLSKLSDYLLPDLKLSISFFRFSILKNLVFSGTWNALSSAGTVFLSSSALIIINLVGLSEKAGDYAIAMFFPTFLTGIISVVCSVFTPRSLNAYSNGDQDKFINEIVFSQKVVAILMVPIVFTIIIMCGEFFKIWIEKEYNSNIVILSRILLASFIVQSSVWTLTNVSLAKDKLRSPALSLLILSAINIFVAVILVMLTENVIVIALSSCLTAIIFYGFVITKYNALLINVKWRVFTRVPIICTFSSLFFYLGFEFFISSKINFINNWADFLFIGLVTWFFCLVLFSCLVLDKPERQLCIKFLVSKLNRSTSY